LLSTEFVKKPLGGVLQGSTSSSFYLEGPVPSLSTRALVLVQLEFSTKWGYRR